MVYGAKKVQDSLDSLRDNIEGSEEYNAVTLDLICETKDLSGGNRVLTRGAECDLVVNEPREKEDKHIEFEVHRIEINRR